MDYVNWQQPLINTFKGSSSRPGLRLWAIVIIIVSVLVRFFAREITWPARASWGTQVEATAFYSRQTALEDISFAFLLFGLALLFYTIICQQPNNTAPSEP